MANQKAEDVIERVRILLNDTRIDSQRWTDDELFDWLNDALREIAPFRPELFNKTIPYQTVGGAKQTLPAGYRYLVNVLHITNGKSLKRISRELLDGPTPNWNASAESVEPRNFVYDENHDPTIFYLYPPMSTGSPSELQLVANQDPVPLADFADDLPIPNANAPALIEYILYRAYGKDAEDAVNAALSDKHYQMFVSKISTQGASQASDKATAGDTA